MKFNFFGIEITIRKEYMFIGILTLIAILVLWGWYLKSNNVEVFYVSEESIGQEIHKNGSNVEKHNDTEEDTDKTNDLSESLIININTADKNSLISLHGIGEIKAQAIIDYREQNGSFKSIVEIKNVKGIGEATFLKIMDRIVVGTEGKKPFNRDLAK